MGNEKSKKETSSNRGSYQEINFKELDALLQFKVTKGFIADYLGVSEDTIERRIKEKFGLKFSEYKAIKSQVTSLKLQQKAIQMASSGDRTMLKFALKNMSGWSEDKEDKEESEDISINIDSDDAEL